MLLSDVKQILDVYIDVNSFIMCKNEALKLFF